MKQKNWYAISAQTTDAGVIAEVRIYDEIGFWGITAKDFIGQLDAAAANAAQVLVAVNSIGGDVIDAFAIYNALRRYAGKVTTRVDAVAASSASLIVMAGDTIVMPENAMMMIHNPWTFAVGDASDLRAVADTVDKMQASFVAAYANRSGLGVEEVEQMMAAETWLTAAEAKQLGLADEIEQAVRLQASANVGAGLARFRNLPQGLIDTIDEVDPASAPGSGEVEPPPPQKPVAKKAPPAPTAPANPEPQNSSPIAASALAAHVFNACREVGIAGLAEPIVVSCGLRDQASVDARIGEAREISGMCVAAKLPDVAGEFVASGLSIEQVRARLFERVFASDAAHVDNRQRPQGESSRTAGGLSTAQVYAARRTPNQSKGAKA